MKERVEGRKQGRGKGRMGRLRKEGRKENDREG